MISGQMDGVYFPIKIKEFSAMTSFRDLKEEQFYIDGIGIKTLLLNHPGYCLGYRVDYGERSICYITDNELYPPSTPFYNEHHIQTLTDFIHGANVLITDSTYLDDEYNAKIGWGHSAVSEVVKLAHRAKIKTLFLYHHDIDHNDRKIDVKLEAAQALLADMHATTRCIAPREGEHFGV